MTTTAETQIQSDGSTSHGRLGAWVAEVAALTTPDRISWVTGSDEEWKTLTDELVSAGTFTRLNEDIKPNSFHCASDPTDVARVEDRTYICSVDELDCGPTNNWMAPDAMKAIMRVQSPASCFRRDTAERSIRRQTGPIVRRCADSPSSEDR